MLLVRYTLYFLVAYYNIFGSSSANLLAISAVTAGLLSLAWLHGGLYENHHKDFLEAFFILNLCIFAAATYHVKETGGNQELLANVSIGTAFIAFIFILLYHVYLRLHKTTLWQKLPNFKPFIDKIVYIMECYYL